MLSITVKSENIKVINKTGVKITNIKIGDKLIKDVLRDKESFCIELTDKVQFTFLRAKKEAHSVFFVVKSGKEIIIKDVYVWMQTNSGLYSVLLANDSVSRAND